MKFKIPSYATMVKIFLLLAPLFWILPYYLMVPLAFGLADPFSNAFSNVFFNDTNSKLITDPLSLMTGGAWAWWLLLIFPNFWLINWIPTTLSAFIFRYLLSITDLNLSIFKSRLIFTVYNAILSAFVSGSIFSFTSFILYELIQTNSSIPYGMWVGQIAVVSIVGFCLGLVVGFTASPTTKVNDN